MCIVPVHGIQVCKSASRAILAIAISSVEVPALKQRVRVRPRAIVRARVRVRVWVGLELELGLGFHAIVRAKYTPMSSDAYVSRGIYSPPLPIPLMPLPPLPPPPLTPNCSRAMKQRNRCRGPSVSLNSMRRRG